MKVRFEPYGKDELEVWTDSDPFPWGLIPRDTPEASKELISRYLNAGYKDGVEDGKRMHKNALREVFGFDYIPRP